MAAVLTRKCRSFSNALLEWNHWSLINLNHFSCLCHLDNFIDCNSFMSLFGVSEAFPGWL